MEGSSSFSRAHDAISSSDLFIVFTGAGCSADSGLAVFNQVPGYLDLCSPVALKERPNDFYAFFRDAAKRYETTTPHEGYDVLRRIIESKKSVLVATSNVDGALQKSGIENVIEIHGNLRFWQCASPCCDELFPASESNQCKHCGGPARPWVLLFEDEKWTGLKKMEQMEAISSFTTAAKKHMSKDKSLKLCILEIGCGDRVPTMRSLGEDFLAQLWGCGLAFSDLEQKDPRAVLVRVNPDPKLAGIVRNSVRHLEPLLISLQTSAKEALCSLK